MNLTRPLIDAGLIISMFYIASEYQGENIAIPVAIVGALLWSRGWSLNGELQSERDLAIMAALLIFWAGLQSGKLEDMIDYATSRNQSQTQTHNPQDERNKYLDIMEQWKKEEFQSSPR